MSQNIEPSCVKQQNVKHRMFITSEKEKKLGGGGEAVVPVCEGWFSEDPGCLVTSTTTRLTFCFIFSKFLYIHCNYWDEVLSKTLI